MMNSNIYIKMNFLWVVCIYLLNYPEMSYGENCKPDWDNSCNIDSDCCSRKCLRGSPGWQFGVCQPRQTGGGSGTGVEEGICSWYGAVNEIPEGWPTACGAPFHRNEIAAAHKTMPCGSRVRVTDKNSGRSMIVTVNDRGPFVPGRILDLTYAAAVQMGFIDKGVINCKIERESEFHFD